MKKTGVTRTKYQQQINHINNTYTNILSPNDLLQTDKEILKNTQNNRITNQLDHSESKDRLFSFSFGNFSDQVLNFAYNENLTKNFISLINREEIEQTKKFLNYVNHFIFEIHNDKVLGDRNCLNQVLKNNFDNDNCELNVNLKLHSEKSQKCFDLYSLPKWKQHRLEKEYYNIIKKRFNPS